jgi:hypothetical protein
MAMLKLPVENRGNSDTLFRIEGIDDQNQVTFELMSPAEETRFARQVEFTLAPEQAVTVPISATPRNHRIVGVGTEQHALTLTTTMLGPQPSARSVLAQVRNRPVVGPWLVEADTARWAKVLGALLGNKVPLMRGLELAQSGLQLPQRRARMGEVTRAVRGGASLADALEDHDALTATGYNLVRVGERSGKLASMLDSLARLYEEAGRNRMKRVLILLEPIAILVIGSMIGTIILGVILAITSANDLAV